MPDGSHDSADNADLEAHWNGACCEIGDFLILYNILRIFKLLVLQDIPNFMFINNIFKGQNQDDDIYNQVFLCQMLC